MSNQNQEQLKNIKQFQTNKGQTPQVKKSLGVKSTSRTTNSGSNNSSQVARSKPKKKTVIKASSSNVKGVQLKTSQVNTTPRSKTATSKVVNNKIKGVPFTKDQLIQRVQFKKNLKKELFKRQLSLVVPYGTTMSKESLVHSLKSRFINRLMLDGKKTLARHLLFKSLQHIVKLTGGSNKVSYSNDNKFKITRKKSVSGLHSTAYLALLRKSKALRSILLSGVSRSSKPESKARSIVSFYSLQQIKPSSLRLISQQYLYSPLNDQFSFTSFHPLLATYSRYNLVLPSPVEFRFNPISRFFSYRSLLLQQSSSFTSVGLDLILNQRAINVCSQYIGKLARLVKGKIQLPLASVAHINTILKGHSFPAIKKIRTSFTDQYNLIQKLNQLDSRFVAPIYTSRVIAKADNIFLRAIENVKPLIELKSKRVAGSTYKIPFQINAARQYSLAIRWIILAARQRPERTFVQKLAAELLEASNLRGNAIKKKIEIHKSAESNRAFLHFRW